VVAKRKRNPCPYRESNPGRSARRLVTILTELLKMNFGYKESVLDHVTVNCESRRKSLLSLGVMRPGREADHSPPYSIEVRNAWSYNSTPPYASMAQDNFTLPLPYSE
jgi:hypothetical protein